VRHSVDQVPRPRRRANRKRWRLLAMAIAFTVIGAWMLVDTLRHPAAAKPGQLWMALSILVMFGAGAILFGYEIIAGARAASGESGGHGYSVDAWVATYSNVWLTIGSGGCIALALAGLFMLAAGLSGLGIGASIAGSLAVTTFGSIGLIGVAQLWRSGWSSRWLSIDATGIRDSRLDRLIAWDEIALIAGRSLSGQRLIEVRLKEPALYVARMSGARRLLVRLNLAFGFAPISIGIAGLSATEADVMAAIERFKPATVLLIGDAELPD
jgi:hypothetical protein